MAAPLFVADLATLKKSLRLSSVPADSVDTEAILADAILKARVRFYRELGVVRTNAIVALTFTETPVDQDGVIRALANTIEIAMVRCTLLRTLPNAFMDASGDIDKRWNEEAPFRELGPSELETELARCEVDITSGLIELADPSLAECDQIFTYDGTPECPAPRIGQSLKLPKGRNPLSQD